MKAWIELRNKFESNEITIQESIINEAEIIKNNQPNKLSNYLENISEEYAFKALKLASEMTDSLELKNDH